MELYIIRHGETDWNSAHRLQGRSDVPLNEYGRYLARVTSEALKDVHFDRIYSSPLSRAYETASIIKGNRDLEIIEDDRLLEICFGDYEGIPVEKLPGGFKTFFDKPEEYVPAARGESYEHIMARAKDFLEDVVVPASDQLERMLIVAHGALNKALMTNLNHGTIADYWSGVFQRNCCVNIYDIKGEDYTLIQNGVIYYDELEGKRYK